MTRPVRWTRAALDDLKGQIAYIAKDHPAAARKVAVRLRDVAEALGEMPTGRPGRVGGTYERSVRGLPYIIAYAFDARGRVMVLRVVHTAGDWREGNCPG